MGSCGLYVHVPFCAAKCGYCDFLSVVPGGGAAMTGLIARVIEELRSRVSESRRRADTIYVGGGTPTVLGEGDLGNLLRTAAGAADARLREFSVEANPESLTASKVAILARHGVNRVSLGAQSFQDRELRILGRIHQAAATAGAVEIIRRNGIQRVSLDLLFGIPGQTPASWRDSLSRAVDLGVDHVSCYGLTYEPGTRLAELMDGGTVTPCDERLEAQMYLQAIDQLSAAGFEHYEISNFAREGGRCEHNMLYWQGKPYIGVGPSAAGYLDGRRYRNVADITEYIRSVDGAGRAEAESETLAGTALAGEMTMLGLRLIEGLDPSALRRRCGVDIVAACTETLRRFAEQGLLQVSPDRIALTRQGLLVADTITAELLAALDGPLPSSIDRHRAAR
ncbi:MAG: radical SAM family heme chaperone HemW [Phycisphaerales bacterium]|nr:MAG: radical SAM family heme chaperone HemW [Phycisphaerales bacterium]